MAIEIVKDKTGTEIGWRYRDRATGITRKFTKLTYPNKTLRQLEDDARDAQRKDRETRKRTGQGYYTTISDLQSYSACYVLYRYIYFDKRFEQEVPKRIKRTEDFEDLFGEFESGIPANKRAALLKFAKRKIFEKNLYEFTNSVAIECRDEMLEETYRTFGSETEKTYSPRTVRQLITLAQLAWDAARTLPGLQRLENPWRGIRVTGSTGGKRQRGLKKNQKEYEKLIEACGRCEQTNRFYIPLAIQLVVDTAMRRQEFMNLTWPDLDFENRRIRIGKTKTDRQTGNKGREIFLPIRSYFSLLLLHNSLQRDGLTTGEERFSIPEAYRPPNGKVFYFVSGDEFTRAVERAAVRAGITNFRPHDLRAAAEAEFARAGLSDREIDIMKNGPKGHYQYAEPYLERIEKALDKYWTGFFTGMPGEGFVLADAVREGEILEKKFQNLVTENLSEGMMREEAIGKARLAFLAQNPDQSEYHALMSWLTKHLSDGDDAERNRKLELLEKNPDWLRFAKALKSLKNSSFPLLGNHQNHSP